MLGAQLEFVALGNQLAELSLGLGAELARGIAQIINLLAVMFIVDHQPHTENVRE